MDRYAVVYEYEKMIKELLESHTKKNQVEVVGKKETRKKPPKPESLAGPCRPLKLSTITP